MQKEVDAAAAAGFRFGNVMGGPTAGGGSEVVVIMTKGSEPGNFEYRLLATNKTSTMQREMQNAADEGYEYRAQTAFNSAFGGKEVVTSTMQKELSEAGGHGFDLVGMTVAQTAVGGDEVVAILRRKR